jgi:aryl-alcohol dehydrogenase-like predicted oxidoreductase
MTFSFTTPTDLPLALGGNVFGWSADRSESFAVLDAFVEAGGSHIDTADSYSRWVPGHSGGESETIIGDWLTERGNRDDLFLATKVGSLAPYDNLRASSITAAVEDSLRRLRTDRIDLYWAHKDDPTTEPAETLQAFDALVRAGKVRYLGASNFSADRLQQSLAVSAEHGLAAYVALQPLYNLLEHAEFEAGPGRVALQHGLAILPYSGLASGFLTGKYRRGVPVSSVRSESVSRYFTDRNFALLDELGRIAAHHGVSVPAVALGWLAQQDGVLAPLASARTPEQLRELTGIASLALSADELAQLRAAAEAAPAAG